MDNGGFRLAHVRLYMHLEPRWLGRVRVGICDYLNTMLFKYSETLRGVVVAYRDVKVVNSLGLLRDEAPNLHFYIR